MLQTPHPLEEPVRSNTRASEPKQIYRQPQSKRHPRPKPKLSLLVYFQLLSKTPKPDQMPEIRPPIPVQWPQHRPKTRPKQDPPPPPPINWQRISFHAALLKPTQFRFALTLNWSAIEKSGTAGLESRLSDAQSLPNLLLYKYALMSIQNYQTTGRRPCYYLIMAALILLGGRSCQTQTFPYDFCLFLWE